MSNSDFDNEMDRYFNDPEYRRKKAQEKNHKPKEPSFTISDQYKKKLYKWGGLTVAVIALAIISFVIYLFQGLPSVKQLENPQTAVASEVRSRDGVVLDRYYTENRTYVPIEKISPHVVDALIATEDHRFYNHWGIDMIRTLSVPWHLLNGRVQGGSTITQQLARNLYKKIGREFSIIRKLREMITAVELEHNYTKREIIEMYLNTVEFPNSAFGIEAAAQTHYGKDAKDLTISQAATLIGSLQAVYLYNPRIHPEHAKKRRNTVLYLLHERGFISDAVYQKLTQDPIALDYHPPSNAGQQSRYFGQYVQQKVEQWTKENGYNLYTDGLTIYTTIDSRLQRHAEQALRTKLDSLQTIFEEEWTSPGGDYMDKLWKKYPLFLKSFLRETNRYKNGFSNYHTDQESVVFDSLFADTTFIDSVKHARTRLEAGFVAIDPNNGNILAWVGGSNYGNVQYDHVYQSKRQAGSTFKPFVYTVAIDNGYKPYHKFSKYPSVFYDRSGKAWKPKDPHIPSGPEMVSLRQALARSLNNVTVRLLPELAGEPNTTKLEDLIPAARKIKQMASNFGIDMSHTPAYPSIALGTAKVSLLDLVSAYGTFANEGVHIEPMGIARIEDKEGNVIKEYHPQYPQEVISPETAYTIVDMLRGVIRGGEDYYGTGVRLRNVYNVRQDIAGKTGTTQNAADNWFVAMTPNIVMGAWVGGEDRRIRFPVSSRTGQGAHTALPIVGRFINLVKDDPNAPWSYEPFTPPPGFVMPKDPDSTDTGRTGTGRIGW
ncbi:MAG: transglycosylase domain-containing protein [Balneolaceae bacterium]|jgi:penicillin-binding protein 1A